MMSEDLKTALKPHIDLEDAWITNTLGVGKGYLWGRPLNHPIKSLNGTLVHTSYILKVHGNVVETKQSVYNVLSWNQTMVPVQGELF